VLQFLLHYTGPQETMSPDTQVVRVLFTETNGGITPPIFNLYNRRRRVVRYIPHQIVLLPGGGNIGSLSRILFVL